MSKIIRYQNSLLLPAENYKSLFKLLIYFKDSNAKRYYSHDFKQERQHIRGILPSLVDNCNKHNGLGVLQHYQMLNGYMKMQELVDKINTDKPGAIKIAVLYANTLLVPNEQGKVMPFELERWRPLDHNSPRFNRITQFG